MVYFLLNINYIEKLFKHKLQILTASLFHIMDYIIYEEPLFKKYI
jgi:hypothetical protein